MYRCDGAKIFMLVRVDDLQLMSNLKCVIQQVKADLALHFKALDRNPQGKCTHCNMSIELATLHFAFSNLTPVLGLS